MRKVGNKSSVGEICIYICTGIATTILNIALYQLLLKYVDYKISNLIAIISAKVLAYVLQKHFVFRTKCSNAVELIKEIVRYTLSRGFTGIVDYFGVIFLVEICRFNESYVKYFVMLIVIVLNYVLGKKAVFITGTSQKTEQENQK